MSGSYAGFVTVDEVGKNWVPEFNVCVSALFISVFLVRLYVSSGRGYGALSGGGGF